MPKEPMRADEKSVQEHPVEGQHWRDEPGVTDPNKSVSEIAADRVATARAARDHDSRMAEGIREFSSPAGTNPGLRPAAMQPHPPSDMPITESERRSRDA